MKEKEIFLEKKMTRKEAIKKTGLVAASAATMMVLMNSKKAQASSPATKSRSGNRNQNQQNHQNYGNNGQHNGVWKSENGRKTHPNDDPSKVKGSGYYRSND